MFSRRRLRGAESSLAARVAVGGVALAAGMTACGGGSDGQSSQSSQVPQAVQGAYKATTSAETVTISLSGSQQGSQTSGAGGGQGQGQQSSISGEATLDFAQNASSATLNSGGQGGTERRTIENVQYQKVPEGQRQQVPDQKPWIKIDTKKLMQAQYGDRASEVQQRPTDPASVLPYLRGVTSASEQGNAQVRGAQTTHYQTTVNLQQATKGQGPQVQQQAQQLQQQLGKPSLPMQLWLDDQGRVRKLETKLPAGGGGGQGQSAPPAKILLTEEFYDYGKSVDISAPDEDKTADLTQQYVQRIKMQQQMQQRQQQQQQGSPQPNQS